MLSLIILVQFFSFSLAATNPIFPCAHFLKGVSFSCFQNGGDIIGVSNWTIFERQKNIVGRPTINSGQQCGISAGFWVNAFDDIELIKQLGCNAVRFSVEWAAIEPSVGQFNQEILDWYKRYCHELIANGIQPTITLHHFTHPAWFDETGGFTIEENINYFERFAAKVFTELSPHVTIWYTINEPTVYSFMGYILGMHSPGIVGNFQQAGTVLKNLLSAHTRVYQHLKKLPHGDRTQIGLVHQVLRAQSYSSWSPVGLLTAAFLNFITAHEVVKTYLCSGQYTYQLPGIVSIKQYEPLAPASYDFIGINYYSRVITSLTGPTCLENEQMTDMEYAPYPEGIYEAIKDLSALGKPIYITENGIPDARDAQRAEFIRRYLQEVMRAREDGYDVRGYFYWTLMDNFEWDRGFTQKFGLYEVNFKTFERQLRPGSQPFVEFLSTKAPKLPY
jgi:beta-glucosidase